MKIYGAQGRYYRKPREKHHIMLEICDYEAPKGPQRSKAQLRQQ
jgi:hypothetical protein